VLNTLIEITQKMVEGEMIQLTLVGRSDVTEKQLLDIAERKTAYLFSGCTKLPAITAGLDGGGVTRISEIGKNLGMAFQLIDDLLDLTSTREALGKPVASDLKEGKVTLPVLSVMLKGDAEGGASIRRVLDERDFRSVKSQEVLRLVERSDGLKRTRSLAEEYARRATASLQEFPASPYREAILSIPTFILNRES
jgi:octaprenyl-diphosphate synthase